MLERIIDRRNFLRLVAAASIMSQTAALNPTYAAETARKHFPTRSTAFDTNSLKEVFLDDSLTTEQTIEEKRDVQALLNQALAQYPGVTLSSPDPEFTKRRWVKFEPDVKYANDLATHSAASIDDIFHFLNNPFTQNPGIQPVVPRNQHDIKFSGYDKIPLYLIAEQGQKIVAVFKVNFGGMPKFLTVEKSDPLAYAARYQRPGGEDITDEEAKVWQRLRTPIFYNTSSDLVSRIESPAIEALHKAISVYTHKHIARDLQSKINSPNFSLNDAPGIFRKYIVQEEIFVHALSILWLEHYNKKTGFATNNDLRARFGFYERDGSVYKGANRMAAHIAKIGIQKAIELYVAKPDQLFMNAGVK